MLTEKSHSKTQQRLMYMVYAYKNGELKLDSLPKSLSDKIKGIADGTKRKTGDKRKKTKGISLDSAKDFASTKHKGLPEKIKEGKVIKFNDFNDINQNENDNLDVISMNVPLFIRLLEYSKEDAKTDMDLHSITENILELLKENDILNMSNYNDIVNIKKNK